MIKLFNWETSKTQFFFNYLVYIKIVNLRVFGMSPSCRGYIWIVVIRILKIMCYKVRKICRLFILLQGKVF